MATQNKQKTLVRLVQEDSGELKLEDGTLVEGAKLMMAPAILRDVVSKERSVKSWMKGLVHSIASNYIRGDVEQNMLPIDANAYTNTDPWVVGDTKVYNPYEEEDEPAEIAVTAFQLFKVPDKYLQGVNE